MTTEHKPGEVWRHRTRDRTVRVVSHHLATDDVTIETVGRDRARRNNILGYNLRQSYARVDDDSGVTGPMVGAEPAALRLIRALDYRGRDVSPLTHRQIEVLLRAQADHTAIMQALAYEADPSSSWPQATSLGRWWHDVADQVVTLPETVERTPTAEEQRLARALLAVVGATKMTKGFYLADPRVRLAAETLDITPEEAWRRDWAETDEFE